MPRLISDSGWPHVVIVGAGFGGLSCATALGGRAVRVTIVDRENHHLFAPLLYQVATAALSPADIAEPIRKILSRHPNIEVRLGEVAGVNLETRRVLLADESSIPFDHLVVATGSTYSYFGQRQWSQYAPGLKTIEDARDIRARLLSAFEEAEACNDVARQSTLMTTVIVGGGPTGVEMAGAVAELTRFTLAKDFRRIDPRSARIVLVEAGPRLIDGFAEPLPQFARDRLERLGVSVLTGCSVEHVNADGVVIDNRLIPAGTVVWAAGVKPSPAADWLGCARDRAGRIVVNLDLSVPGHDRIYAIGDTAAARTSDGNLLPGLAQVAKQQGRHLGHAIAAHIERDQPLPPFRYKNRGNAAIVGRDAAVFDFGRYRLRGRFAWLLWAVVHIYLLNGFENRLLVSVQWLWRYLTYERGARLIANWPSLRRHPQVSQLRRQAR